MSTRKEFSQEQYDQALYEIVTNMTVDTIASYPGVMEILSEELNNEILSKLEQDKL